MREVLVKDKEIRITGSKAILARAASGEPGQTPPAVLSFVREWRAISAQNYERRTSPIARLKQRRAWAIVPTRFHDVIPCRRPQPVWSR
ncbi:hypothetical protein, partial [Rhodomicrobium vannielii]|uniref:hypothetical protein n=1 Tax=Rhodomicrobium vannielii TaxID=1069 RepID=UPI001AEDC5F8